MTSKHYENDRKEREAIIRLIGYGIIVGSFKVDRGHKNGLERHEISSTGIITIYNDRTNKLITKLVARPGQIRRYYNNEAEIPTGLIDKAIANRRQYAI